jgi:hypothetical protein
MAVWSRVEIDPNDLFAQGCLQVHQISDRVWVYHDMVDTQADVLLSTQHMAQS